MKNKTKHTPGPWQLTTVPFELGSADDAGSIYGPTDKHGGSPLIASVSRSPGDAEAEANLKLINSAPNLLETLIEINFCLKRMSPNERNSERDQKDIYHLNNLVAEAIKKATE